MANESKNSIHSKTVIEVITIANDLCIFMEEFEKYDLEFAFLYMQKVLPLLYLKGAMLPEIENTDEEANERFVTQEQWEAIFNSINKKTDTNDTFYFVEAKVMVASKGSIAECLADIYQDLKDFLLLYQKNTLVAQENAVYYAKELFEKHWGSKLLNVHKAIHTLLYKSSDSSQFNGFSSN
ncbi:MAG: DUF5063 domain-containing protein [Bacteroidota bacterium]